MSLHFFQINTVDEPSNQRLVKFKFNDPSKRRLSENYLERVTANVIPVLEYQMMYPDKGFPLNQYIKKSTNRQLEAYRGVEVPLFGTVSLPCGK